MSELDVLRQAEQWRADGEEVAIATVVATRRSAPRPVGAKLAVSASGKLFGSVSGGCVESDVAEHAREVLEAGGPRAVRYRRDDENALAAGLAGGGGNDGLLRRVRDTAGAA